VSETATNNAKDFFISYTGIDEPWAEWIAWHLEAAAHSCEIQIWDFTAGANVVTKVDDATRSTARTIAVLSPDYLTSGHTLAEWAPAFAADPTRPRPQTHPSPCPQDRRPRRPPCPNRPRRLGRSRRPCGKSDVNILLRTNLAGVTQMR